MAVKRRDVEILQLANRQYRHEGFRVSCAYDRFGRNPTAFWRAVNALLDDPAVVVEYPELTLRLRRLREQRQQQRRAG